MNARRMGGEGQGETQSDGAAENEPPDKAGGRGGSDRGCGMHQSLPDGSNCLLDAPTRPDGFKVAGGGSSAGTAGGACYYSLKRPPTVKIGRHMPIRAIFAAAGFRVRT